MENESVQIRKLTEQNEALENYFRNTIIPQLFIDAHLILQKFTPPAMKQFNLRLEDVGKPITEIKDNFRFPSLIENIQSVIDSRQILEKEIQTTDLRWYQMNIIPYIKTETGKADGIIMTFVEITSRIKDLKAQEKSIADFETLLDTISHDLKTPLTSLGLAIGMFKNVSPENKEQFQSLIKIVENGVSKMRTIINELTENRKQEFAFKSEIELLSFEHIVEDVRLTLADNIAATDAVIKSDIKVSEILFSRRKLRSIIYNLISNAIKFKSAGTAPEIFIETKAAGGYIIISVKDNGIGIDANKQEAIFSKYYRADNNIEGSGIGLYLVKELVASAGGKIVLTSAAGKGAQFDVYLKA